MNPDSKYVGKIFKIPFPFTDLSAKKARPALAISEPDEYGDAEFLFITTKKTKAFRDVLEVPKGILPFDSVVHLGKRFLLHKSIIIKELAEVPLSFLEEVLRRITLGDVSACYQHVHAVKSSQPFVPGESKIRYAGRVYDEKEMISLVDASLDFWLTSGRFAKEFEEKFAEFFSIKHAILTNSGSSANLLALSALTSPKLDNPIKPGDEVITVAAAFPTTVNPIVQNRLVPVFLDVELGTYNIDANKLEDAVTDKTKAIMLAHTMGNPFDLDAVMDIAKRHNLFVIEDACDAVGSTYDGKLVGTFGDIGTVSFYPAHHITMGEGGALITDDTQLARNIRSFRDWGRDCWCKPGHDNTCGKRFDWQLGDLPYGYDHKYIYSHIGYNLKVTDMQAAVGVEQLKKLPSFIEARKSNFRKLYDGLKKYEEYFILPEWSPKADPSWFGFLLTVKEDAPFSRNEITEFLEDNKIATRNLFAGNIIRHPAYTDTDVKYRVFDTLENTDRIMNDTFWIGVYPGLTDEMISYVLETYDTFLGKWSNRMTEDL